MSVEVRDEDRQAAKLAMEFSEGLAVKDIPQEVWRETVIDYFAEVLARHRAQSPPASAVGLEEAIKAVRRGQFTGTDANAGCIIADAYEALLQSQPVGVVTGDMVSECLRFGEDDYDERPPLDIDATTDALNTLLAARPRADGGAEEPVYRTDAPAIDAVPIGNCPRCGVAVYTQEGFCGGCE